MDSSLQSSARGGRPPDANPAEAAFAELSGKVDFLETLLRGLVAKREEAPDYSETLGEIAALLEKMRGAIKTLAARPAMEITPDAMAAQIAAAGKVARADDSAIINQARDRIDKAAARMEHLAGTLAIAREQRRHLLWVAIGGLLAGMLLWSFLPGVVLRAMPQSWHMPENMARHIIGEPTLWETGARLMQVGDPKAWNEIVAVAKLRRDNHDTIIKCERAAVEAGKTARCTIRVEAPGQR